MTTIFFMGHTVQNRSFRFFYNPSICMGLYWSMKTICLKTKISHYLRNLVCKIKSVKWLGGALALWNLSMTNRNRYPRIRFALRAKSLRNDFKCTSLISCATA